MTFKYLTNDGNNNKLLRATVSCIREAQISVRNRDNQATLWDDDDDAGFLFNR